MSRIGQSAAAADADQPHPVVGERDAIGGARHLEPQRDRARDLDLGRDDHVDRHMLAAEQVLPAALQIALLADARDLGRHVEQRMRDLAGDHVDLVGVRHRDQHVGVGGARLRQHARGARRSRPTPGCPGCRRSSGPARRAGR